MSAIAPRPAVKLVRTPERQALADAIERHRRAAAEVHRIQTAQQRHFEETRVPLYTLLKAATAKLAELKVSEAKLLAAAYLGENDFAAKLSDAKRAADDAKHADEEAEKVREGLEAHEAGAKDELYWAVTRLCDAHSQAISVPILPWPGLFRVIRRRSASRPG